MIQMMLEECANFGPWLITHKGDPACRHLADKHYSRQSIGAKQFCRPGRNLVLRTAQCDATMVFWSGIRDDGLDAYEVTLFRNESNHLSSDLIKWGLAAVHNLWGCPPPDQIITYVNPYKVKSRNPGYCFKKAGFYVDGKSKRGLLRMRIDKTICLLNIYEIKGIQAYELAKAEANRALERRQYIQAIKQIKDAMRAERNIRRIQEKLKCYGYDCCTSFKTVITNEDLEVSDIAL